MKILLAGCTGYIGQRLIGELAAEGGHELVALTRRPDRPGLRRDRSLRYERWSGNDSGGVLPHLEGADAVVNLCGDSVADGRWTDARKKVLVESRVGPTETIVRAVAASASKPRLLVNASAAGYYGDVPEGDVTEDHPAGDGFLASLCVRWEDAALEAASAGVNVVMPRLGVVLGRDADALKKMMLPFSMFVGGPIGSGQQWFPWVHIADVTGVIRFALSGGALRGPVNVVAPEIVRMREFAAALGRAMGRPSWAPVPGFAVKAMLGELAGMILGGARIVPSKLKSAGYAFVHPSLDRALADATRPEAAG